MTSTFFGNLLGELFIEGWCILVHLWTPKKRFEEIILRFVLRPKNEIVSVEIYFRKGRGSKTNTPLVPELSVLLNGHGMSTNHPPPTWSCTKGIIGQTTKQGWRRTVPIRLTQCPYWTLTPKSYISVRTTLPSFIKCLPPYVMLTPRREKFRWFLEVQWFRLPVKRQK